MKAESQNYIALKIATAHDVVVRDDMGNQIRGASITIPVKRMPDELHSLIQDTFGEFAEVVMAKLEKLSAVIALNDIVRV